MGGDAREPTVALRAIAVDTLASGARRARRTNQRATWGCLKDACLTLNYWIGANN